MPYSTKLSDALHILVYIETAREAPVAAELTSTAIARSLACNPASVRQLMGKLRRAGLLNCVVGHARPALARPAAAISMLDVYRAVEGTKPLLHLDTHTNPACGVGVNAQLVIGERFAAIQQAAEDAMEQVTLADIIADYRARTQLPTSEPRNA